MGNYKKINAFSLTPVDIKHIVGDLNNIFFNDSIIVVPKASPRSENFLREGEIYHLVEPRIVTVLQGSGDIYINLEEYHIEKGTVITAGPDMILEVRHMSSDALAYAIIFREEISIDNEIVVDTTGEELDRILRMIYLIWDIVHLTPFRSATINHFSKAILSEIGYIKKNKEQTDSNIHLARQQEMFTKFKQLVSTHCDHERNIPFYAEQLMITPHHLSAIIKKVSGQSVMYWINRSTIQKAKMLLTTTNLMVYEVANRLHFPTDSAFSKFFKREVGTTPRQYQIEKHTTNIL